MRKLQFGIAGLLLLVAVFGATVWIDHGNDGLLDTRTRERIHTTAVYASAAGGWLASAESQSETIAAALEPWTGSTEQTAAVRGRLDGLLPAAAIVR